MRDRFGPRSHVDIVGMVTEALADWVPPRWDDPVEAQVSADELNEMLGLTDPDDMWTADGMIDLWSEYAPEDDDEARRRLAASIVHDVREAVNLPGPRSVYRQKWVMHLGSALYQSGVMWSGGSYSHWGRDPHGAVYDLPGWRSVRSRNPGYKRMRPYVLWLPRDWWECQIAQGWRLRGRHRPGPFVHGLCGHCCPWPCCGAVGAEHAPSCVERVFP